MLPNRLILCLSLLLCGSAGGAETLHVAPDVYNRIEVAQPDPAAAESLFTEAQQAAERGEPSLALQLASRVLSLDPNHAVCRQVLGYEEADGQWVTPHQAKQAKRGLAWHRLYGWVKPDDLPRLEAGERPIGKRWVDAPTDAKQHARIEDGWQVRTDHFIVTTNLSPEAGVILAAELEGLFQVWRQLFAGYYLTEREIAQRFAGERSARKQRRLFKVFYHRDKQGYVEHLKRRQPRIAETLGIYFDVAREAHFFHADNPEDLARLRPTLYHEAVHQLFAESSSKGRRAGETANFWVVEGIACCFETLAPLGDGRYQIGQGGRLGTAAAQPAPAPIAQLAALGRTDYQRQPELAQLYAQSTALAMMLLESDREALVDYLREVYSGRPGPDGLTKAVGRPFSSLDTEYRDFRQNLPR